MQQALGETIRALLASKQKSVPPDYLWDREHVVPLAPWTENDPELLRRTRQANPRMSWANIAAFFPAQTTSSVRARWRIVRTQELNALHAGERNWEVMRLFLGIMELPLF
jgi:hypothetical protein